MSQFQPRRGSERGVCAGERAVVEGAVGVPLEPGLSGDPAVEAL